MMEHLLKFQSILEAREQIYLDKVSPKENKLKKTKQKIKYIFFKNKPKDLLPKKNGIKFERLLECFRKIPYSSYKNF